MEHFLFCELSLEICGVWWDSVATLLSIQRDCINQVWQQVCSSDAAMQVVGTAELISPFHPESWVSAMC